MVPESIRWLITKKRYPEASQLILKAAKINKKIVPKHLLLRPSNEYAVCLLQNSYTFERCAFDKFNCCNFFNLHALKDETNTSPSKKDNVSNKIDRSDGENIDNVSKEESIIDVFRSPVLLKRLVIMFLAWYGFKNLFVAFKSKYSLILNDRIAAVMGYYGITFASTNLSENFFLNYELSM